jgi:hypothetical protein
MVYWWEVQFEDRRNLPVDVANYSVTVESIALGDVDRDEKGHYCESTHFIEQDAFVVVKTVNNDPFDAIKRAVELMRTDIRTNRESVVWADIRC